MTREEAMNSLCKFSVGQMVVMAMHREWHQKEKGKPKAYVPAIQPLQVVERIINQCHGGVQTFYLVRPHIVESFKGMAFATELARVTEIELAECPEDMAATETL